MSIRSTCMAVALLALAACTGMRPAAEAPMLIAPSIVISGDDPGFRVTGLAPGETVTLHALRLSQQTGMRNGSSTQEPVTAHAWARFKADRRGIINVSSAAPISGSYEGADFNGLFWSGYPEQNAAGAGVLPAAQIAASPLQRGDVQVALERDGAVVARHTLSLRSYSDRVVFTNIAISDPLPDGGRSQIAGVFAAPKYAAAAPTLILLHGSEGYSVANAKNWAGRMAERGFAALALAYVAYPRSEPVAGVSEVFINVPVEIIERARDFLAARREADVSRLGVYGISKGAEFSLVAASRYPWIRAVVACVPSDVVWAGFGAQPPGGIENSSWSFAGAPLPAIAYDRYEDVFSGAATAEEVHRRSRAGLTPQQLARVRIPVGRIAAKVLLIGAGADETWPSLEMAKAIETQMRQAGRGDAVQTLLFPGSTHGSCGTGTGLQRIDPEGDPAAIGKANSQGFQATIALLRDALR